jgi:hypothetical protein
MFYDTNYLVAFEGFWKEEEGKVIKILFKPANP